MSIRFCLLTAVLAAWVPVGLAEMPQRVNDELVSAYRTDLVGPEVWTEWIALELPAVQRTSGVRVYWYDDEGRGSTRVPSSWSVETRTASGDWKSVPCDTPIVKDRPCVAMFASPVETGAIRLRLQLRKGHGAGLLSLDVVP